MKVYAVIPTYNEEEVLSKCLTSLDGQLDPAIVPIVVNAGKPLSPELAQRCCEVRVPDDYFWTSCMKVGFEEAKRQKADYILMSNADITFMPGTAQKLLDFLSDHPNTVACSAGYLEEPDGRLKLLYSRDMIIPILYHNFLVRDWTWIEEAPQGTLETGIAGGQGVMFPTKLLDSAAMDPVRFPHRRSDHDFWLQMKKKGIGMFVVCQAAIVNQRALADSVFGRDASLKKLWWYAASQYSPESVVIQWRLRTKHQPIPLSWLTFIVMTPGTWVWRIVKATFLRGRDLVRGKKG